MIHDRWYYAAEPENTTLPYVLERVGEDRLLVATDYPHRAGNLPEMTSPLRKRDDLTTRQKDRIMRANAIDLYGWK